ncbi:hypothetical protein FACS1894152_7930 [Bacilli bacterium]|nr:hypothetical protein FACS1894152_7930 [Bacilli bacterium]
MLKKCNIAIIVLLGQLFRLGSISALTSETIEREAKSIIEQIKVLPASKNKKIVYLFDFDNTIHTQDPPWRMEGVIDEKVIMASLFDRVRAIDDIYSQKIIAFLLEQSSNLKDYKVKSFDDIRRLFKNDKKYREDLTMLVSGFFKEKAAPNHRISYLLEFGCSPEQIEANYTNISRQFKYYYTGITPNPVVVEIMCQLIHAKKKVFILTDNTEANVLVGANYMKLEDIMRKRLAELGTKIDKKIPIFAGETDIHGILPVNPKTKPMVRIISIFKHRPEISNNFFEISTKKCTNSRKVVELELEKKYNVKIGKNTALVLFDDSASILDNVEKQGIIPVFVEGANKVKIK